VCRPVISAQRVGAHTGRPARQGLREAHPLGSHFIDVRCFEVFIAHAGQLEVAEFVYHDINDVRLFAFITGLRRLSISRYGKCRRS